MTEVKIANKKINVKKLNSIFCINDLKKLQQIIPAHLLDITN